MHNKKQLESQIITHISDIIIEELDNPAFDLISISEVELNNDNSVAKVYVNFMENEEQLIHDLRLAGAFIRREMAQRLSMRKVPFFEFEIDTKLAQINQIEKVIKENN